MTNASVPRDSVEKSVVSDVRKDRSLAPVPSLDLLSPSFCLSFSLPSSFFSNCYEPILTAISQPNAPVISRRLCSIRVLGGIVASSHFQFMCLLKDKDIFIGLFCIYSRDQVGVGTEKVLLVDSSSGRFDTLLDLLLMISISFFEMILHNVGIVVSLQQIIGTDQKLPGSLVQGWKVSQP